MADIFMADTHFGHKGILGFEPQARPYKTVEEMNQAIIDNVNSVSTWEDTLYILGDVGFSSCYEPLKYLQARKIIIVLGNHDYPNKIQQIIGADPHRIKVCGASEYKSCILTHIPVHECQMQRFRANIHGHLHTSSLSDPRYICVSLEQNNMRPFTWEELVRKLPDPKLVESMRTTKLPNTWSKK